MKVGNVIHKSGYVTLAIYDKVEVLKVIKLINGFMRTKKIYQLHTAIKCFNQHYNSSIPLLGLDLSSSFRLNSWFAGFTTRQRGIAKGLDGK